MCSQSIVFDFIKDCRFFYALLKVKLCAWTRKGLFVVVEDFCKRNSDLIWFEIFVFCVCGSNEDIFSVQKTVDGVMDRARYRRIQKNRDN